MARTISKAIASATVYVFDPSTNFELDENGMPMANRTFQLDGNPSENKARIQAQQRFGKNVMVLAVEVDETKLRIAPATFIANSEICKPDTTYGREYITQTFKVTTVSGFYTDADGLHQFSEVYAGETTANKLRNWVCDKFNTQNAVVANATVSEERRYMSRETYLELAK